MTGKKMFVDNTWTDAALTIERDAISKLKPIMEVWLELGYEPHEISHIFMIAAQQVELEARMNLRMKKKEANDAR